MGLLDDVMEALRERQAEGVESQARRVIYMVMEEAAKEIEHNWEEDPAAAMWAAAVVRALKVTR